MSGKLAGDGHERSILIPPNSWKLYEFATWPQPHPENALGFNRAKHSVISAHLGSPSSSPLHRSSPCQESLIEGYLNGLNWECMTQHPGSGRCLRTILSHWFHIQASTPQREVNQTGLLSEPFAGGGHWSLPWLQISWPDGTLSALPTFTAPLSKMPLAGVWHSLTLIYWPVYACKGKIRKITVQMERRDPVTTSWIINFWFMITVLFGKSWLVEGAPERKKRWAETFYFQYSFRKLLIWP